VETIEVVAHASLDIGHRCGTFARLASIWKAFILITCILLFGKTEAHGAPAITYRTAESILSLSYDKAVKSGLAELRGTVTLSSPVGFVLQDDTAGIWVEDHRNHLSVGDVVTVLGTVGPGAYSPQIEGPTIRLNGHARLPHPKNVSFVQLSDGQEDAQYVAIEGVIRAVTLRDDALTTVPIDGTLLMVDMPGGRIDVALPTQSYKAAVGLIGAKVRVSATALARKNDDRQATGVMLIAPGIEYLTVLQAGPRDLFSTRMFPIGSLLQYRSGTDYFQRVRIQGTLTYYEQGHRFILQDRSRAIVAYPANSQPLQIGDHIEAVGFLEPDAPGPVLRNAVVRRLANELPPAPMPVDLQMALKSSYRSCLVSIHLRLVRVIKEPTRTLFLLESGHTLTSAELAANIAIPAWLQPGSDLKLTGINMLTVDEGMGYLNYQDTTVHSVLLLRSLDDITLISPATWWTHAHLLSLIIVLGILLAIFLILLIYIQLKHWKTKLTLRERERLARDVHDTLAQSFAGVGFQLQVIHRAITTGDPSLLRHVDTARELVQFSHREARKSLAPCISHVSVGADLLSSLHENAQALIKGGVIEIEANSSGSVRTIPRHANEELFRIGQEAIANAIRHANPTQLAIRVEYEENLVRLKIIDNGKGFVMRGDLLGFGIRGMRKRAAEINAQFDLVSVPGAGTTVAVTAPIQNRRSILFLLNAREMFLKSTGER
jgi:signal transduction histidine kinase